MKRTFLFSVLPLITAFAVHAQLAPRADAPLYRHMLEVNAQWRTMDPALVADQQPVHFRNEAERIAKHLHLVAGYLRSHTPAGLTANAMGARTALLNDLDAYASRGLFPQNHALPYRNPVFIDPQGTACAVGQLIIDSGHRDLAERISHKMNMAYVHDMHSAELDTWASAHGFTENELAWIQPSYPPAPSWAAPGGGTNGPVTVLLRMNDGNVVVAGDFTQAGNIAATNVALWNGSSFLPLGNGVAGTITCGAVLNGTIYLGGSGLGGNHDLAQWSGTQWSYSSVFQGNFPQMFALHVHNGNLYAAGAASGFIGTTYFVQELNGITWQGTGADFGSPVLALGSHIGHLVAGGSFTTFQIGDLSYPAQHVAILGTNGWAQLGDGLNGAVNALLNANGTLYAGGAMYAGSTPLFGLARMGADSTSWQELMPGLSLYITGTGTGIGINTLTTDGAAIYVGGDFAMTSVGTYGNNVAQFLGSTDSFTALAQFDGTVNALVSGGTAYPAGIIAGGEFTGNGNQAMPYLAEIEEPTGIKSPALANGPTLFPNPAGDLLNVVVGGPTSVNQTLDVIDASGRRVLQADLAHGRTVINVSQLAPGSYTVRTEHGASRFVKR